MKKQRILAMLLLGAVAAFQSCSREELPEQELQKGVGLQIADFPTYSDTKAIGTPDKGKASWENGDMLRLVFQTAENPCAAKFNIIRKDGVWQQETTVTLPGSPCRALVFYAPAYEFGETELLTLKDGHTAGLEEFFEWKSGDDYDITDPATVLSVSFTRKYSRLRIASEKGFSVKMEAANFVPAGYGTSAIGTDAITTDADDNGNAFFFGKWADASAFSFTSYDEAGEYSFNEYFPSRSSGEDGKSYAISCKNDGSYLTMAQIAAKATSKGASFSGKVKNVVVSYTIGQYACLEDGSGAVSVFMKSHNLSAGMRINGTVSGTAKLYNKLPQITSLTYSSATVTTDGAIPCTEMTIKDLLDDFNANLSRRILLKGVSIDKGISSSNRTGSISQSGSSIAIYAQYSSKPAEIETGLTGDLIAFPALYNTTKELFIFESSQFTEGGGGEDTPFTRLTVMGYYTSTDTDSPVANRVYADGSDQYSFTKSSSSLGWHLFNLEDNDYMLVEFAATALGVGAEVSTSVNRNGISSEGTYTVVKKAGTSAWLEDKTAHDGYVIALQ